MVRLQTTLCTYRILHKWAKVGSLSVPCPMSIWLRPLTRLTSDTGRCFRGEPFGLRVLEIAASRWPARPAGSYEESLAVLLEAVDGGGLFRQRSFAVLLAGAGAYRLPLLLAVQHNYEVAELTSGWPLSA